MKFLRATALGLLALFTVGCVRTRVEYVRVPTREWCLEADRIPPRRPFHTGAEGCPAGATCFTLENAVALAERLEELEDHAAAVRAACGGSPGGSGNTVNSKSTEGGSTPSAGAR